MKRALLIIAALVVFHVGWVLTHDEDSVGYQQVASWRAR